MTAVGFEPTPFRNGALSHRLRPLGQTVMLNRDVWAPVTLQSRPRKLAVRQLSPTARLAQSAERKALNLVVVGSSPTVGVFPCSSSDGNPKRMVHFRQNPTQKQVGAAHFLAQNLQGIRKTTFYFTNLGASSPALDCTHGKLPKSTSIRIRFSPVWSRPESLSATIRRTTGLKLN